mmetsp:Transcript_967/g.1095  ORF Transcript_967/g.1095 Transcript_967/m.1095 type:complete len:84 (-) Transcript_967:39-290(-)
MRLYGRAVYVTEKGPHHGKRSILENNYGREAAWNSNRADRWVSFKVSTNRFQVIDCRDGVWMIKSKSGWAVNVPVDQKYRLAW